ATLVGALLTVLLLALRFHDLTDTPIGQPMDAEIIGFVALACLPVVWLARRIPSWRARRAAPTVLLAASVPVVVAAKILVDTAAIAVSRPVPVALAMVALTPVALTLGYRVIALRWIAPRRLVTLAWAA